MANVSTEKKAAEKLKEHQQNNPYAEKIDQLSAGVGAWPSLTGGKPKPTYSERYVEQLDQAVADVTSHPDFSYDVEKDPTYQAYAKAYKREGDRATQDAIGKAAAVNGGALSTAGVQAGAQAGQYYASQLADKIPTLYADAYARHLDEYKQKASNVDILSKQEATDYNRHRTEVNDWERAEATDYDRMLTNLDINRTLDNDAYSRLNDDYLRERDEEATDYSRNLDKQNKALSMWQQQGYASKEVAEILGIPEGTPTSNQKYYDNQAKQQSSANEKKETYNELGWPTAYESMIYSAGAINDGSAAGKGRALGIVYNIALADEGKGLLTDDTFEAILRYAGLTSAEWDSYVGG